MIADNVRIAVIVALLLGTGVLLEARRANEVRPNAKPLSELPVTVGDWRSTERAIPTNIRDILGPGDYLDRVYHHPPSSADVEVFIGYLPSQRTGNAIHSPQHCLPGAGWQFQDFRRVALNLPKLNDLRVNEAVLAKGGAKIFVLYWYQAHGRGVASEYWAKFYLVADAVRMNRTDGALVRFTTPILPGETREDSRKRALTLAAELAPALQEHVPD